MEIDLDHVELPRPRPGRFNFLGRFLRRQPNDDGHYIFAIQRRDFGRGNLFSQQTHRYNFPEQLTLAKPPSHSLTLSLSLTHNLLLSQSHLTLFTYIIMYKNTSWFDFILNNTLHIYIHFNTDDRRGFYRVFQFSKGYIVLEMCL